MMTWPPAEQLSAGKQGAVEGSARNPSRTDGHQRVGVGLRVKNPHSLLVLHAMCPDVIRIAAHYHARQGVALLSASHERSALHSPPPFLVRIAVTVWADPMMDWSESRDEGGLLTLRLAFTNESGGQIKNSVLPGKGNVENFALLDNTNRRKYLVVRDSGGGCLCTSLNPFGTSDSGRRVFWAKFGSPPASVDHVTLLMPDAEPVDGVPISR